MRLARDSSALLIVDLQERLLPHIHDAGIVLEHAQWLLGVARRLGVPVIASEQYPSGLGATAPALRALLEPREIVEKVHFSCVAEGCLQPHPAWERQLVVICGTEAHVCVLQTALGLLEAGKTVFVVAEAVGSRKPADRDLAIARMRQCGAQIVSREMVAFEWLGRAATDEFRDVSRRFLR
jgi:nicotinamidase-related amidase